jgi:hypothetical protein
MYNSNDGYQYVIAAVISNMANIASNWGKVRHIHETDLFLCHPEMPYSKQRDLLHKYCTEKADRVIL